MGAMANRERLNLLSLRKDLKEADPAVVAIFDKKLRDNPFRTNVPVTFTVVDPFLEICEDATNLTNGGYRSTYNLGQMLTRYLVEEMDPAWWTPEWGASWFVTEVNDIDPKVNLEAEIRAPGRTSKQSSYPDDEDTKLTFANIEECLKWAVAYIDANADEIRELLDDES